MEAFRCRDGLQIFRDEAAWRWFGSLAAMSFRFAGGTAPERLTCIPDAA
jgi:hypothetical protein